MEKKKIEKKEQDTKKKTTTKKKVVSNKKTTLSKKEVSKKTVKPAESLEKDRIVEQDSRFLSVDREKEVVNKEEKKDKKKYLIIILLLLFLFVFIISVTFGKEIYEAVSHQVIEVLNLRKPSAPVITGGSNEWAKERLIRVEKDSDVPDGLAYYEYCISNEESTKKCKWQATSTKNVKVTDTGIYYVTFRAVDKEDRRGYNSNTEVVYIDNNNPVIQDIKIESVTTDSIELKVDAKDSESGVKKYLYSLDGKTYQEGKKEYTYTNLAKNTKYIVYVKVEDRVGNITILNMEISTKENDVCNLNCDTNNDGKCDLNCDTDNDGKCDLNCDTDKEDNDSDDDQSSSEPSDPEQPIDPSDPSEPSDPTPSPEPGDPSEPTDPDEEDEDLEIPEINLDKVPVEFTYGSKYDLPSYYKFGPSGGEVECTVEGQTYTDTSTLEIGTHVIECIARGNNGINVQVSKQVEVIVNEGIDEIWDGWIKLNLYYPENSTNWQWRVGKTGEIRDGYQNSGWQDYTGPILVRLEDVDDVYIRYEIDGEVYVKAPSGKVAVDIEPNSYSLKKDKTTKVQIYYEENVIKKEYRIGNGDWLEYTGSFEVGVNTIIEARAEKQEKVYDSEGNYVYTSKIMGTDSVFIGQLLDNDSLGTTDPGEDGKGETSGGLDGNTSYEPVDRGDGTETTGPVSGSKPSTYLEGPVITVDPNLELVESVNVTVTPQYEAEKIYISVDGSNFYEYHDSLQVDNNGYVKAYYIRKSDGIVSDVSYYYIQNIKEENMPYVRIDATPDNYITDIQEVVEVKINGSYYNTLEYSLDGVIYEEYTGAIKVKRSSTVYARGINDYGTTIEKLVIPTLIPAEEKEDINIDIYANPASSKGLINKTLVTITYDSKATKKYYKLAGEVNYKEYTGPFEVTENTTVYAYATGENASGSATKGIDFLTTGIMAPVFGINPTEGSNVVTISITFDKNATNKYYQIDGGEKLYYTGPFEVYKNSTVYAYNSNVLGYEADNEYEITNIISLPKYLVIDKGKYYIIKLNYPESSAENKREYKWKPNGKWKVYDEKGIVLIKPEYKDEYDFDLYDGIKVEDENGKQVVFTDHYYLIDVPFNELMENLFMRWDTSKAPGPKITVNPSQETTNEVEVNIQYSNSLVKRYYKIVEENGTDTGWIEYNGTFKVDANNSVVYAKGITVSNTESNISSVRITNIDNVDPIITIKGDFITPKQQVLVTVAVSDNKKVSEVKWVKGEQSLDYFSSKGTNIKNPGTFKITENGKYTIYAKDEAGNEVIKVIEVTNIDNEASDIIINVLTEEYGTEVEVSIDYGDSETKEYKIGKNGNYQQYTKNLIISSYDVHTLANEDGSLTIYAKGTDEAGNIQEVNETIYLLDLDVPSTPIINAVEGYPVLTEEGFKLGGINYIIYDETRDDLTNYYRIDGGEWKIYDGPFEIETGTIEAKSVKNNSDLVVESKVQVKIPEDAIGENLYDDNLDTTGKILANEIAKFTLEDVGLRKVRIHTNNTSAVDSYVKVYDKNNNELESIRVINPTTLLELPEDGYKVEILAGSSDLEIKEITLKVQGIEVSDTLLPIIKIDNSNWTTEKIVNITYPIDYKGEYSIDGGITWLEYTEPFKVESKVTVIARTLLNDTVVGASSFTITKIDTSALEINLDIPSGIKLGTEYSLPTSYKVGESGGSASCKVGDTVVTNTSELEVGTHEIVCTVKNNAGNSKTISKTVKVIDVSQYKGDSILEVLSSDDIISGKYDLQVNNEIYPVHVYVFDEDQHWTTNQKFGDDDDIATATTNAQRMVIVKVNGNVTIDSGVTVGPWYNAYGGPKGFTLYVTGTLTNNGTIDNSHGAKAVGQNVYLWKNADGTYEYVPATGGAGGASVTNGAGTIGNSGNERSTGGGGSGAGDQNYGKTGAGAAGTSYSGGTGGGARVNDSASYSGGTANGGSGGKATSWGSEGGGAGNPGGTGGTNGSNGTGGLLTIYANNYINKGIISANGATGGSGQEGGGSSGGGSINLFINNETGIDQLGIVTNTRYNEIKGTTNYNGGAAVGTEKKGGAGGSGTVNIGTIRDGQYYDLKEAIDQDKEAYIKSVTIEGDSILSILEKNDLKSGYYYFVANGVNYPVHLITYDEDTTFSSNQKFGDANDVATASTNAQNMVIVKVNGNLTINSGVKIEPYYNNYGGPKGFTLYVTGTLTNNGTIDNSHGAKAVGQNVYLWKNTDGTYEYVPATGGTGGKKVSNYSQAAGKNGNPGSGRQTGGGGSGGAYGNSGYYSGAGGSGTSYSGGTGGGGSYSSSSGTAGSSVGGAGGNGTKSSSSGGAGNPGGTGKTKGANGTGGLLTIYANNYLNKGTVSAAGKINNSNSMSGGSSGGGSINIFYVNNLTKGSTNVTGGKAAGSTTTGAKKAGGAGGAGTVTYTKIPQLAVTSTYTYPKLTSSSFDSDYHLVTINYLSSLTDNLYSLDNGITWLDYSEPIKVKKETVVLAKGIKEDGTETEIITYTVPTVSNNLLSEIYDGNNSTAAIIPANTDNIFTLSNDLAGKSLRFFLNSIPADDATIKIYISSTSTPLTTTFVENLTVISIPENAYKIVINSGSSELSINEINIRELVTINDNLPLIETSSVDWTTSKTVIITYPEGYRNEYSLDLGENWYEYTDEAEIVVDKPTTVLTRTLKNDKVISSSSYTATKIDTTEPTITLDLPDEIILGDDYNLPTNYSVDETKSGGNAICKIGEAEISNTKDLGIGSYEISCTVTTGAGKEVSIIKNINVIDEAIDITLDLPERILVGSSYQLPTSVTGTSHVCKIGDTIYTSTDTLEVGTYEIVCNVTSIGGNTKEIKKQIEVYKEDVSNDIETEESEVVEDETTTE